MERVRVTELKRRAFKKAETLNKMLTKPTKKIHVKSELQKSVASFLSALNLDTVNYSSRIKFLETRMRFAEREVEEELKRSGITKNTADAFEEQFRKKMERRIQEIQNSKEWAELRQMSMLDKIGAFRKGLKAFLSEEDSYQGERINLIMETLERNILIRKIKLEKVFAELFRRKGGKVCRCDIKNRMTAYVVVSMTKIEKTSVMGSTPDTNVSKSPLPVAGPIYSTAQIVQNVNPTDRNFLKYLPDQMLNPEQIKAKKIALEEDQKKLEALKKKSSVKEQQQKTSNRAILADLLEASIDTSTPEGVRQEDLLDVYRANEDPFETAFGRCG